MGGWTLKSVDFGGEIVNLLVLKKRKTLIFYYIFISALLQYLLFHLSPSVDFFSFVPLHILLSL